MKLGSFMLFQRRLYGKVKWKTFQRNTEVYDLTSDSKKPSVNVSAYGNAQTGALGIKQLISIKRSNPTKFCKMLEPLYYFFNPVRKIRKMKINSIACGYGFTLFAGSATKPHSKLYGCGLNSDFQLGYQVSDLEENGIKVVAEPKPIALPVDVDYVTHISCGRSHSIVATHMEYARKSEKNANNNESQVVFSFGNNDWGQCGREVISGEVYHENPSFYRVNFPHSIKQIECGEFSTYILTKTGEVYSFGRNSMGELGIGETKDQYVAIPQRVLGGLKNKIVSQISCRGGTVLALTDDGEVYGWGDNENNLIYCEIDDSVVSEPRRLPLSDFMNTLDNRILKVCAGATTCGVVDSFGHVYTWGIDLIGHGPKTQFVRVPTKIPPGIFGEGLHYTSSAVTKSESVLHQNCHVTDLVFGVKMAAAVTATGSIFVWGDRVSSTKSLGGTQTFPLRLANMFRAEKVFVGYDHMFVYGKSFV